MLHYPNRAGSLDFYAGYSLPIQPATARIVAPARSSMDAAPSDRVLTTGTTGLIFPAVWVGYSFYLLDPKFFLSIGVMDHFTLVAEAAAHRVGLSIHSFTRIEGPGGFKLAGGGSAGFFVGEFFGWLEGGWLPVLSKDLSGYVGLGVVAGRLRHFFRTPNDLDIGYDSDEGVVPTLASFADLLRTEFRLRVPLGVTSRPSAKGISVSFAATPYLTLAHGRPELVNCRCISGIGFDDLKQHWGVELQIGMRR